MTTPKQLPDSNLRMPVANLVKSLDCNVLTVPGRSKGKGRAEPQPDQPPPSGQQHPTEPDYDAPEALPESSEDVVECAAEVTRARTRRPAAPPPSPPPRSPPRTPPVPPATSANLSGLTTQLLVSAGSPENYAPIIDPDQPTIPDSAEPSIVTPERAYDPRVPAGMYVVVLGLKLV